jgi:cytosine/adenosine deaminase-related metal-dependent hydrolase
MPEEIELLERGNGRLKAFLKDLGAWDDDWEPIGPRPADFIRRGDLRKADWLIAHGNYLQPDDFWQLRDEAATEGQRVAVAYCPRTHARFGHAPHPFRAMLEKGIVVCIGTDSLASTPTLSVLDELRFMYKADSSLGGELLLTMGTLFGAWALRAETVTGSLRVGKSADLAIIGLPDRESDDPYTLLFESDLPVLRTVFDGVLSQDSTTGGA